MENAEATTDDIDQVILIGGSTKIPAVQNLVRRSYRCLPAGAVVPAPADKVAALASLSVVYA